MWRKIRSLWVCLLLCLSILYVIDVSFDVVENVSGSTTLYVNTTGDGGAFTSIQDAIDAAQPGDTVFVYNGTYYENIIVNKTLNLTGESRNSAIIDGGGNGVVVSIIANFVTINNFTITGSKIPNNYGVLLTNVIGCDIINNNVSNNNQGILLEYSNVTTIKNNIISSNHASGIIIRYSNNTLISWNTINNGMAGSIIIYSDNNNITNNNFYNNSDSCIWFHNSNWNNIKDNFIYSIYSKLAIVLEKSIVNKITGNIMLNSGIFIQGYNLEYWDTHNIDITNTVNGKVMYFWKNIDGGKVPDGAGQIILVNCRNITIENQELTNTSVGISSYFSHNNSIISNNISSNRYGIYMEFSNMSYIGYNNISLNDYNGIKIDYSAFNNISYCNIFLNHGYGIFLEDSTNSNISSNDIYLNGGAIYFGDAWYTSSHNNIYNNNISNNGHGIQNGLYNNVLCNNIYSNEEAGIKLDSDSCNNLILGNNISLNKRRGIYLLESSNNYISNNTFFSNNYEAIYLESHSINNTISYNNISFCTTSGIHLKWAPNNNRLIGNNISYCEGTGISLSSAPDNTVSNNYISNNGGGIGVGSPQFTWHSSNEIITNNTLTNNGIFISGSELSGWNTHYIHNNTANGRSIYYYKNVDGGLAPTDAAEVILANCTNFTINGINSSNVDVVIELGFSSNNEVMNNNGSECNYGIYIASSWENNIESNFVSNHTYGIYLPSSYSNNITDNKVLDSFIGILLDDSDENNIKNNYVSNTTQGIRIESSTFNTLTSNTALSNIYGILLFESYDNNITRNNLSYNRYGIYFSSPNIDNFIYNNNFINNEQKPYDGPGNNNYWDNGYPIGGNYWSNYNGVDEFSGPGQNQPGGDGIGDSYYGIDTDSKDHYPLMMPYNYARYVPKIQLLNPMNNSIIQPGEVLDFLVYDDNTFSTNYSVNGDSMISFLQPFDIATEGWEDGIYTIKIIALDIVGFSNSSWYTFTIDSSKPVILLNSPANSSIIKGGTPLNFSIVDMTLLHANYSVNNGSNISFSEPFNISTIGWTDGNHFIQINALDLAGYSNSSWYIFIIDSAKPNIMLNSPGNNSVIPNGTILDFSIIDENFLEANYSINGGSNISFSDPFNISTTCWPDDDYKIQINAIDMAGNTNSLWYFFTLDSTKPIIQLNSPQNNSIFKSGVILDFLITDEHFIFVNYSINGGSIIFIFYPYNISTVGWDNGGYTIQINTLDQAGNSNSSWFFFTIDSTRPKIILNSPSSNSIIPNGTVLDFSIVDLNLLHANYSINGGIDTPFTQPYNISTSGWPDGDYSIQIQAIDLAGNLNSSLYFFTIDSSSPQILLNAPQNNSVVLRGTNLNFSIFDPNLIQTNYSVNSEPDIPFSDPFDISTSDWPDNDYTIQINALDIAGNLTSKIFHFVIDSTNPIIQLNSPNNNSFIHEGIPLDFNVIETNLLHANYSINDEPDIPFTNPFNISTSDRSDDEYVIRINALDLAGNSKSASYFFTIDSTKPTIVLNSPENNSYIPKGTILDFLIEDTNLMHVNYSINGEVHVALSDPYTIPTSGLPDDEYIIKINTIDLAGNSNSSWFFFTLDSTKPEIHLNSPENKTVIKKGTKLNFTIYDINLLHVNYSVNGGTDIPLSEPFDIPTADWVDGKYKIQINSADKAGNSNSSWFLFTIDSTKPTILLDSPEDNSIFKSGMILDFAVSDTNLHSVHFSLNGGEANPLSDPFDIPTKDWSDGDYAVQITAQDLAGNLNSSTFFFTIDSTPPSVDFDPSLNQSTINGEEYIEINISAEDLDSVMYSVDGEDYKTLKPPYRIYPYQFTEGKHTVHIKAKDNIGNEVIRWFEVIIETTPPYIVYTNPQKNSINVDNNTVIKIRFSEPMNESNIEDHISIYPPITMSYQWNEDGTLLTISFSPNRLVEGNTYCIVIDSQITDISGNKMGSDFELAFSTGGFPISQEPPSSKSEPSIPYWFLLLVLVIIIILFLLFLEWKRVMKLLKGK